MPTPDLPLELLGHIVDFHGEREKGTSFSSRPRWSATLLACHRASRQLRACALQHLCREFVIGVYDSPKLIEGIHGILFPPANSNTNLGGVGEFVKELVISILPHEQPGGRKRDHNPTIHEGALLAVLKDIGEKVKLKQLHVRGHDIWDPPQWDTTPLGVRVALESLMHLPTVSSLLFKSVGVLPVELFSGCATLRELRLIGNTFQKGDNIASGAVILPKLGTLKVDSLNYFPWAFSLPSLRHFHAHHMGRLECITSWDIINRTCETLEELNIFDEAIFDTELLFSTQRTLDGFPQLQTYVCSYSSCQSEREILHTFSNAVGFLKSTRQHLHLRAIKLHLDFDARSDIWEAEIDSLAKHSTWKVLDKALASENLPVLKSVDVKIKLKILGAQNDFEFTRTLANRKDELLRDAREASQKRVRLMMMETLSATQRLRIPLKLDVSVEV